MRSYKLELYLLPLPLDELVTPSSVITSPSGGGKVPVHRCKPGQFRCQGSEECVSVSVLCDGRPDCKDHSDEINCGRSRVKVAWKICVSTYSELLLICCLFCLLPQVQLQREAPQGFRTRPAPQGDQVSMETEQQVSQDCTPQGPKVAFLVWRARASQVSLDFRRRQPQVRYCPLIFSSFLFLCWVLIEN